jgi:tRNA(fMet)-specific endonuclease VapC
MAKDAALVAMIQMARFSGSDFGISITVLAELYHAVYTSYNRQTNLGRLQGMLEGLVLWPFDEVAAEEFGKIQAEQRAKGRPIPAMDVQIAAVVRTQGLTLLTADRHFQYVDQLVVENWLDTSRV